MYLYQYVGKKYACMKIRCLFAIPYDIGKMLSFRELIIKISEYLEME